jgi:hypothetical protein
LSRERGSAFRRRAAPRTLPIHYKPE